jgi:hypothetical protein
MESGVYYRKDTWTRSKFVNVALLSSPHRIATKTKGRYQISGSS